MNELTKTATAVDQSEQREIGFRITDIPRILFEEISQSAGMGEKFQLQKSGRKWEVMKLNPAHRVVRYPAAIGWLKTPPHTIFALWNKVPTIEDCDTVFEAQAIVKITAGVRSAGVWTYDLGDRLREDIVFQSDFYQLNLKSPAIPLAVLILMRAAMLATDPQCDAQSFWEKDFFAANQ